MAHSMTRTAAKAANPGAELIHRDGERLFITSLELASRFEKQHKDVLRAIEGLGCSDRFRQRNFALTVYERPNPSGGKPISAKMFEITRDGFAILAMGFTGRRAMAWKERYIGAFNAMERALRGAGERALVAMEQENARLGGELLRQLRAENARLEEDLTRARTEIAEARLDRQRALWAQGPMGEEEHRDVTVGRLLGLSWTRLAKARSYRSPGALAAQYRRYGARSSRTTA